MFRTSQRRRASEDAGHDGVGPSAEGFDEAPTLMPVPERVLPFSVYEGPTAMGRSVRRSGASGFKIAPSRRLVIQAPTPLHAGVPATAEEQRV